MRLVDSHCHLDDARFDDDRDAVVQRAQAAGVGQQVVPATHAGGWAKLRAVCAGSPGLFAAYGLHPMFLQQHEAAHIASLGVWIDREQPVAVGECGLDFWIDNGDREAQQTFFDAQLRLARQFNLPVIVHARRAVEAVIASLRRFDGVRGVVHSFSGSAQQAAQLWDLGVLVGLGGPVTHARAQRLRRFVTDMPLEQLLLETDAPDQPDAGIRGQRNEPARVSVVCDTIAALRSVHADAIADATVVNARRLFGLPDPV